MNKGLMWLIGIVVGIFLIGSFFAGTYNSLVSMDQGVKESWAQVENQLQRRFDLIPNLVETVKGYAKHEKGTFENIAQYRTAWAGAKTQGAKVAAANGLEGALSRLMVVVE